MDMEIFGAVAYFSSCFWHIYFFEYFAFYRVPYRRLLLLLIEWTLLLRFSFIHALLQAIWHKHTHTNLLPTFIHMCFMQANQYMCLVPITFQAIVSTNSPISVEEISFREMHRKLITCWIPSQNLILARSVFEILIFLTCCLLQNLYTLGADLFEYSNRRNWSTKNVNYIHELVYRLFFYFTSLE